MTEEMLKKYVHQWLASNEKKESDVLWASFPLGMVGRWIERAENAEQLLKSRTEPKGG